MQSVGPDCILIAIRRNIAGAGRTPVPSALLILARAAVKVNLGGGGGKGLVFFFCIFFHVHGSISNTTGQWSLPMTSVSMRASRMRGRRRSDTRK